MIDFEPPMSPEETLIYLKLAKAGNRLARHRLILSNGRLVVNVAKSVVNSKEQFLAIASDIISEGIIGLSVAISKYELDSKATFPSYAIYWIRAYIGRYLINNASILHIPYTIHLDKKKDKELLSNYRRQALEDVKSLKILGRYMEGDEGPIDLFEVIPDKRNTVSSNIDLRFDKLPTTDLCRNVMDLKFNKDFSNVEISTFLGVSRERIRQLIQLGLARTKLTPMQLVNNRLGIELKDIGMFEGAVNKVISEKLLWDECSSMPKRLRCKYRQSTKTWMAIDEGKEYNHASDIPKFFIKRSVYMTFINKWVKTFLDKQIPIQYDNSSPSVDDMYIEIKDSYRIQIGHGIDADKINIINLLTGYQIQSIGVSDANKEMKKILDICKSIFT